MPTRIVKYRSRKPVKKKSRKPVKKKSRKPVRKSRKPAKKKSRKPAKKKSRKPAKKKSRKPAKKKSRKSKSKFKVRKDRVFTKHGQIGGGKKLKKKEVPSLFDLAAQKLPLTSEWADGSDLHLKSLVMKPQQKGLKKIMGSELIQNVSSRVEPVGDIEPLSEKEINILMGEAFRLVDERPSEDEVNRVYSTLKNLREIPKDNGHYSRPEFFLSYADRLRDAKEKYMRKLRNNLQEVKDDIQDVKEEEENKDKVFDFERDYTFEDDKGNMLIGSTAARSHRQFLDQLALKGYKDRLDAAESYRNDLYNYANALVENYVKYDNNNWWLMDDFGENNELYHRY